MSKICILLADRSAVSRLGFNQILAAHSDSEIVAETDDGNVACQLAEQLRPNVALISTTLNGCSSLSVTRRLAQAQSTRVIIYANSCDKQQVYSYLVNGASGYLAKSDPADWIHSAIRAVHRGSIMLSPRAQESLVRTVRESFLPVSSAEQEILQLMAQPLSNQEIAQRLDLSMSTIRNRILNIYRKIPPVNNRAEAVAWAWREEIVKTAAHPNE